MRTTTKIRLYYLGLLVTLTVMAAMLLAPWPAYAAGTTFTVTSTADTGDLSPVGVCDTCTLSEAIQATNECTGDTSEFSAAKEVVVG